jgi:hypothetical protein
LEDPVGAVNWQPDNFRIALEARLLEQNKAILFSSQFRFRQSRVWKEKSGFNGFLVFTMLDTMLLVDHG